MSAKKLENMSDVELMDAWTDAAGAFEEAKSRVRDFSAEYEERESQVAARKKFESMNDTERAALAQVFEVEGIESGEVVSNG